MSNLKGPSIRKRHFSKQDWHSDDFGLRSSVIQKHFSGNALPLSLNASLLVGWERSHLVPAEWNASVEEERKAQGEEPRLHLDDALTVLLESRASRGFVLDKQQFTVGGYQQQQR